jgi:hypothetical protein
MLTQYPITGLVYASNGSTKYPDVNVTVRNTTKNSSMTTITESDGSFAVDLKNFIGGYSNGDALTIEAEIGSFYQSTTGTVDTNVAGLDFSLTLSTENCIGIINKQRVMEELITFFRKKLTDSKSRGTVETTTQSGTGSKVKFTLPRKNITCLHSVVDGVIKTDYTDYYVDYKDNNPDTYPIVYFLTPPANNVLVDFTYHYSTDWIYPDVPRVDISLDSYPRVSVRFLGDRVSEAGLGATSNLTDILGSVDIYSSKESEIEGLINNIRKLILQNKKNFHYFKFITLQNTGPVIVSPNRENKILQQNSDFIIMFRLEVI